MNKILRQKVLIVTAIICLIKVQPGFGQQAVSATDSLSLNKIISDVIQNHPTIKEAEQALNIAESKKNLAKSTYFPDINVTGNYTRLGPVQELTLPGFGTFQLYPENNYNTTLNVHETIWDFGRTENKVKIENANIDLFGNTIEQTRMKMALTVINNYYALVYLQEAINIKKEQKQTLEKHLDWVKKKQETGSAIEYEILSLQVKISAIESQLMDLDAAQHIQQSVINSLLGQPENTENLVKKELNISEPSVAQDSLVSFAIKNRSEMLIEKNKAQVSELTLKLARTQRYPVLDFIASGGFKNGYVPELNKFTANYAVGVGIKVPILDGMRTKYNIAQAKTMIQSNNYHAETIRRNITNEVTESEINMKNALQKIDQYKMQYSQAQKALELAEVNFKAGAITNLDLLDATTAVSESRLFLLKSQIDYVLSIHKLKASLGINLY